MNERFLILTREAGAQAENLVKLCEPLGKVEVVVDRQEESGWGSDDKADSLRRQEATKGKENDRHSHVWIPDEGAEGFGGLMSRDFPWMNAWSRAVCHLSRSFDPDEAVWFVEDDVAGEAQSIAALVNETAAAGADLSAMELRTKAEDGGWYWWEYADGYFEEPCRGFQPLCRLSGRLLKEVLAFRERHGKFIFHEVLFASLVRQHGMRWLDWEREPSFRRHLGTFRYRPAVTDVTRGLSHPVKDSKIHEMICALPPTEFPRMRQASLTGWSIFAEDYVFLARYCRKQGISRIAEFGPGDSTLAFLDAGCKVASFEHDADWLLKAVDRLEGEDGVTLVHCPEGTVPSIGEPDFEPELVFVDGPPYRETQVMSRLQPCEWALERCGCFILHDASREGEKATLEEMERRGMKVTCIPTRKGLAIVVDPKRRPEMVLEPAGDAVEKYGGGEGWFRGEWCAWSVLFQTNAAPVRVLEVGVGNGASANLMLDLLFTHAASEVHCIDLYEGEAGERTRAMFESNARTGGHSERLLLYEGLPREVLAWMIAGKDYWESFDFVHLATSAGAADVLEDACQAWELLKPGGILAFGSRDGGRAGCDAFLSVYADRLEVILEGGSMVVRKVIG